MQSVPRDDCYYNCWKGTQRTPEVPRFLVGRICSWGKCFPPPRTGTLRTHIYMQHGCQTMAYERKRKDFYRRQKLEIPFDDLGLLRSFLVVQIYLSKSVHFHRMSCLRISSKLDSAKTTVARITRGNCTIINVIQSSEYHNFVFISTNEYVGYTEGKSLPTSTWHHCNKVTTYFSELYILTTSFNAVQLSVSLLAGHVRQVQPNTVPLLAKLQNKHYLA